MTDLDLTALDMQQLKALLWDLKGTPAVQPIYDEFRARSPNVNVKISDPDWDRKTDEVLRQSLGISISSNQNASRSSR